MSGSSRPTEPVSDRSGVQGDEGSKTRSWWPLNHWTDSELRVHGLYCSMAQLLRSVIWLHPPGPAQHLLRRLLSQSEDIRQVIDL